MTAPQVRKYQFDSPPRSVGWAVTDPTNTNPPANSTTTYAVGSGLVAVIAVSTTPIGLAMRPLYAPPANQADAWSQADSDGVGKGVVDCYVSIFAEGVDIGVTFGQTAAQVSVSYAPNLAAVGSVSNGLYTPNGGECWRIPAGMQKRWLTQQLDLFMGIVGSGAGIVRIYQSSPHGV